MIDSNTTAIIRALKLKDTYVAAGYQKLSVTGGTAQSLTVPTGTIYAEIQAESATTTGAIMRYLLLGDGTAPTTTSGIFLVHGQIYDVPNADNIVNFRVIAISGTHTLHIQYYKGA